MNTTPTTAKEHWDNLFSTKNEGETSWFQPYPKTSVEFLELFDLPVTANIIDVGAGDSYFINVLLDKGFQNIWVLDISEKAIERLKKRLGDKAQNVHWVVSDVTDFQPDVKFDFWHDRAAFHFLTTEERINQYVALVKGAIKKDGYLILGTFSENGPEKCSGLEIRQYSRASMSDRFNTGFKRIKCIHEDHQTPFNTVQQFLFCSFKRIGNRE
jgi:SAM-dependent methyltransferase